MTSCNYKHHNCDLARCMNIAKTTLNCDYCSTTHMVTSATIVDIPTNDIDGHRAVFIASYMYLHAYFNLSAVCKTTILNNIIIIIILYH